MTEISSDVTLESDVEYKTHFRVFGRDRVSGQRSLVGYIDPDGGAAPDFWFRVRLVAGEDIRFSPTALRGIARQLEILNDETKWQSE